MSYDDKYNLKECARRKCGVNLLRRFYAHQEMTPGIFLLFPLLLVLSFLYAASLALARGAYLRGWRRPFRPRAKVISVGNITLGGCGKTPFVETLARRLSRKGRRPAVLLRGFKKPGKKGHIGSDTFYLQGDEAGMLARNLTGAADVFAAPDRAAQARFLDQEGRYDVYILDDGFQHWRLARDLDIVMIDAARPFGNGLLLPAGPLREEIQALSRAHVFCLSRSDEAEAGRLEKLQERLRDINPRAALIQAVHEPVGFYYLRDGQARSLESVKGLPCGIFCGIARPDSFLRAMEKLGAVVKGKYFFEDHHEFTEAELRGVAAGAREAGAAALVTTEKDAVRIQAFCAGQDLGIDVFVLKVALKIRGDEKILDERLADLFPA